MTVDLTGRPIAITGGSSGIGRAAAIACARAGMPVAVGARRLDRLRAVVEEIEAGGGRAVALEVDVNDPAACAAFIDRAAASLGGLYGVFANAGYGCDAPVLDMSDQEVRGIFDTNVFGALNTVRPAVAAMRSNDGPRRGHVLLCSSCVARMTVPHLGAYSATKASLAHMGTAMRHELATTGVYVSTVHPVATRTAFLETMHPVRVPPAQRHRPPKAFTQRPEAAATRVVGCLRRPRPEVWTGPPGWITRMVAAAATASPRFGEFVARRSVPK